jgi:hypothetical protein
LPRGQRVTKLSGRMRFLIFHFFLKDLP